MNDRIYIIRESIVKLTQMLAGRGIKVTQQGISAYVKADPSGRPILVNLPYIPDNATTVLIDAIQGFLDHEVAHILFTEFTVMETAAKSQSQGMLNLIEDTRIEREMAKRFQGSAQNLANTGRFFLDHYTKPRLAEAQKKGNADEVKAVLMVPLVRALAGQQVFREFMRDHMATMQEVHDKIVDMAPQIEKVATTRDALTLAEEVNRRLRKGKPAPAPTPKAAPAPAPIPTPAAGDDAGEDEGDSTNEEAPAPAKSKPKKSKPPKTPPPDEADEEDDKGEKDEDADQEDAAAAAPDGADEGEEGRDEPGADEDEADEEDGDDEPGAGADEDDERGEGGGDDEDGDDDAGGTPDATPDDAEQPLHASLLDAIDREAKNDFDDAVSNAITSAAADAAHDADYLIYSTDKDIIEPLHVGRDYDDTMLTRLQDKVDHMVAPLQKDLERAIAARSLSQWSAGHRAGRLHAANLSRLAVGDDRVFRRKHEATSKDVAVELVVDASGSMMGSKIHCATQAAYALAAVLERIGIASEVICFTTGELIEDQATMEKEAKKVGRTFSRYERLNMPILKSFNERMTTDIKRRFGWLPNSSILANNVDGESIQIAARRLMARREKGKIMMVLSDGAPNAYSPGYSGSTKLASHLKKAVEDISNAGVKVIGIGIESTDVRRFYPRHLVLNNVAELPMIVMKELRQLVVG